MDDIRSTEKDAQLNGSSADEDSGKVMPLNDGEVAQFYGSSTTQAYRLKSELVGQCMEEIGMGRFQWKLWVVTGFGWVVDNVGSRDFLVIPSANDYILFQFASQGIGSVQPPIRQEFSGIVQVSYSSVAYYVGLILGAAFWGTSSDLIGRRPAFNFTLLIAGTFLCAAAGSMNFIAFSGLWAVIGTAAGGQCTCGLYDFLGIRPWKVSPLDPRNDIHQYLLTALSAWWNMSQLVVSLIAWVFLANFSCPTDATPETCRRQDNMGWRYTLIVLGGLALCFTFIRLFIFKLPETPRYLLSQGRDEEAVEAVNYVARQNGKHEPLTIGMMREIDARLGNLSENGDKAAKLSKKEILAETMQAFKGEHFRALFATRKLSQQTLIIWAIWLTVGIAYPLYFNFLPSYLATKFTQDYSLSLTYRNYCIVSAVGIVGPLSAAVGVNTRLGRRWMMGISAAVTGVFLFAYVGVNTPTSSLAFSCVTSLLANFEYAVMYAFTPESFPAPHRGTGYGTAAALLRLGGLVASLISSQTGFSSAPIYVSAALWVVVGGLSIGLPFETHGHGAL
ncbi:hypothetical protein N7509_002241 [Penicillium cosmopolitanum]|uniref:Major facilitator superfamily (MFS) profile domain-containing protein n=1 Tax=Penicillium cosmopolitanum TaxID=1131564 RepID=A0A9X0BD57_9EURO|nr:uncharacterized protein N7509_002241 [Penicillium cosmopolitanum]KAJ5408358.1 hypothetical protein N7509_002241 [Penicillium cosmopolitanum]